MRRVFVPAGVLLVVGCGPTEKSDRVAATPAMANADRSTGGYAARFPGGTRRSAQAVPTAAGTLAMHVEMHETADGAWAVSWVDYPAALVRSQSREGLLDGARDGAARNVGGRVVAERPVRLGVVEGREVRVEGPGPVAFVARFHLVDNRLYQVMVTRPKDRIDAASTAAFLDSFRLVEEPTPRGEAAK